MAYKKVPSIKFLREKKRKNKVNEPLLYLSPAAQEALDKAIKAKYLSQKDE